MAPPDLGLRIKGLRAQRGITREGLAALARVSVRTIARIEDGQGEPRADTMRAVAEALGVKLGELLD
jgi:transcriptional regulator with XRE-family HTH domain